ncbi:MAG: DNA starvation/stationary phase protection protein [Deltaproteobacteria bacterium]|nr:DNA starvation/stationary phase protection protein [Deltaproteobacteria bacterium]
MKMKSTSKMIDLDGSTKDSYEGKNSKKAEKFIKPLQSVLASLYAARLKSQVYHWQVHGPNFYGIHKLLEEVYKSLDQSIDDTAERIRTLGMHTVSSFSEIIQLSAPANASSDKFLSTQEMIADMQEALDRLSEKIRSTADLAEEAEDIVTVDMLTRILGTTEKFEWMVRSLRTSPKAE